MYFYHIQLLLLLYEIPTNPTKLGKITIFLKISLSHPKNKEKITISRFKI